MTAATSLGNCVELRHQDWSVNNLGFSYPKCVIGGELLQFVKKNGGYSYVGSNLDCICSFFSSVPWLYCWKGGREKRGEGLFFPLYLLPRFQFAYSLDDNLFFTIIYSLFFCSLPYFRFALVYITARRLLYCRGISGIYG